MSERTLHFVCEKTSGFCGQTYSEDIRVYRITSKGSEKHPHFIIRSLINAAVRWGCKCEMTMFGHLIRVNYDTEEKEILDGFTRFLRAMDRPMINERASDEG